MDLSRMAFPISFAEIEAAAQRIAPYLSTTPCREYPELNHAIGDKMRVWVKHENHQPTNSFKVRNTLSAVTAMSPDKRRRGVIVATRGNHGLGVCYAGAALDIPVTICVPEGNNPEKNSGMLALGAKLVIEGKTYDDAVAAMERLAAENNLSIISSTNCPEVIAGAGTVTAEILKAVPDLDAMVVSIGGGSQAVGAMVAAKQLRPNLEIFGVQAESAPAIHNSWHAKQCLKCPPAFTIADGLATGTTYEGTFGALCSGLCDFITVTEIEIKDAMRMAIRYTHNLVEGAGAVGLAGLWKMRQRLQGKKVAIVLSGANVDQETLRSILT